MPIKGWQKGCPKSRKGKRKNFAPNQLTENLSSLGPKGFVSLVRIEVRPNYCRRRANDASVMTFQIFKEFNY